MFTSKFILAAVILGFVAAFIKPSFATVGRPLTPLSKTILDFEPLRMIELHENSDNSERTLNIKFTAFEQDFDVKLLHRPSFSNDTIIDVGGSKSIHAAHLSRSYRTPDHTAALTLDEDNEGVVRGIVQQGNDIFHIMTSADVHSTMQVYEKAQQIIYSSGSPLIIVRDIDMIVDPDQPQFCGTLDNHTSPNLRPEEHTDSQKEPHMHLLDPKFRSALRDRRGEYSRFPPPKPCTTKPINLNMGFAADHSFLKRLQKSGQTFQSWLDSTINIVSALYMQTFHTTITVTYMYVPNNVGKPDWNSDSCTTIYDKLSDFSKWRGQDVRGRPEGLFHLMSACYSSGAIGLAWTGVLCRKSAFHQSNGWVSGTGVSSGGGLGWTTVAHEIGHQFGAPHDKDDNPKGIMYPYTSSATKFTRQTQLKVCSEISMNKACFTDANSCTPTCPVNCGEFGCCDDNGCGGSCGTCPANGKCYAGVCKCKRNCDGRQCGNDGCGGQCGTCGNTQTCVSSKCVENIPSDDLFLKLHNLEREKYHQKPLIWSNDLKEIAEAVTAKRCFGGSFGIDKDIGYTIFHVKFSSPKTTTYVKKHVFNEWKNFGLRWTCSSDYCPRGKLCRDYTQIINENVNRVGCVVTYCTHTQFYHTMCAYDYNGKYASSTPFDSSQCQKALTASNVCQPKDTCESADKQCGTFYDGCATTDCGKCARGTECQNNTCVCVPSTSCAAEGKTCGTISIGCGQYEKCGSCDKDQCVDNRCFPCQPSTSCEEQNRTCGVINDGCGRVDCGACLEGSDCEAGKCSLCSNCDDMGICENAQCKCRDGFFGNGYSCNEIRDIAQDEFVSFEGGLTNVIHNSWDIPGDKTGWLFEELSLVHETADSSGSNFALLNEILPCSDSTVTTYTLNMMKTEESGLLGVTFPINSDSNLLIIWYDSNDRTFNIGFGRPNIVKREVLAENINWPNSESKRISVSVFGQSGYTIDFGGHLHEFTIDNENIDDNLCQFGTFADSYASFSDVNVITTTQMEMTLITEVSVKEFQVKVAHALGISEGQINDVTITRETLNRQDAFGPIAPIMYTFSLTGSSSASSTALASSLTSAVAQQSSSLAAVGLVATSSSRIGAKVGADAPVFSLETVGLSAAAIAGMVCGGVALVGVTAAGGIYMKKHRSTGRSSSPMNEVEESHSPSSKEIPTYGVNVMDPDVHVNPIIEEMPC